MFRAIYEDAAGFYTSLIQSGAAAELARTHALVQTQISKEVFEGVSAPLILEHERISPVTYCTEWSFGMYKDAAIRTLELALALNERNMTLQDATPYNILFKGPKPVIIDFTSAAPIKPDALLWQPYQQFVEMFHFPLLLASMGRIKIARHLMTDSIHGVTAENFLAAASAGYRFRHPLKYAALWLTERIASSARAGAKARSLQEQVNQANAALLARQTGRAQELRGRLLGSLLKKTRAIRVPAVRDDYWDQYAQDRSDWLSDPADTSMSRWTDKQKNVHHWLRRNSPARLLDLGCNRGWYSLMAGAICKEVIAADYSEACVEAVYAQAAAGRPNILPVVLDILAPIVPSAMGSGTFPHPSLRFKSDAVLALALIHHLHITGRQSYRGIAAALRAYGPRALVEYVAPDDPKVITMTTGKKLDYTLDSVAADFREAYGRVEVLASDCGTRKLLDCGS